MKTDNTTLIRGHTVAQRRRLFALARLLVKVPAKFFFMEHWVSLNRGWVDPGDSLPFLRAKECGYAGCAMGWGMTSPAIRGEAPDPFKLLAHLGFSTAEFRNYGTDAASVLFGPHRDVTPRRVASDLRRYLKDGTLPK